MLKCCKDKKRQLIFSCLLIVVLDCEIRLGDSGYNGIECFAWSHRFAC